jgi:Leucine-rich repeat (LRR) protein
MFHSLPGVLMRVVGEYAVDSLTVLHALLNVSAAWRQALEHPNLVSHLRLVFEPGLMAKLGVFTPGVRCLEFPPNTSDYHVQELCALNAPCELDFTDCYFVKGKSFRHIPEQVHTLKLSCCRSLTDFGLLSASHCTALRHLQLLGCPQLTNVGLRVLSNLPNLQFLDLSGCSKITNECPLGHLTALKTLKVAHCHRISEWTFLSQLPKLELLDLSWCSSFDDASCAHLQGLPALRNLNVRGCYRVTDDGLQSVSNLPLSVLNLCGCINVSLERVALPPTIEDLRASGCEHIRTLDGMSRLTRLRELYLDDCLDLRDVHALCSMPNLQLIDLTECVDVADLEPLASAKDLRELRLTSCKRVKTLAPLANLTRVRVLYAQFCDLRDDSLAVLSKWHTLRDLNLIACRHITDRGLQELGKLTRMRKLDLMGCALLTDAGLNHLQGMSRLTELSVGACQGVSLLPVVSHLRELQSFQVSDCPLEPKAIETIGSLTKLKILSISGGNINDSTLQHLKDLPLERLDLEALDMITDEGLAALLWSLRTLQSLYIFNCQKITDISMPSKGTVFSG